MSIGSIPARPQSATSETLARDADKRVQERVQQAEKNIQQAELEEHDRLQGVRDRYTKSIESETDRKSAALEQVRQEGYEAVLNERRKIQSEIARLRAEGEKQKEQLKTYYEDEQIRTTHAGEKKLRDERGRQQVEGEVQDRLARFVTEMTRTENIARQEQLKARQDERTNALAEQYDQEFQSRSNNYAQTSEQARTEFQKQFEHTTRTNQGVLHRIQSEAARELEGMRADFASRLDAYSTRAKDPFYRLVELGGALSETNDAFVFRASVPSHEQDGISVSLRGNTLVIQGKRRSSEKIESAPGREVSTASYQTYMETHPLTHPVEARALTKSFSGDELTVVIPKKAKDLDYRAYQRKPKEIAAERPKFPDQLPLAQSPGPQANTSDGKTSLGSPPGTQPLS
jgi:HSP20 family molecular chaperone IbpA